jgi:hypothetical protein
MDLTSWLETEKGRALALAAHFGRTPAAISQWKKNGVPVDLMKEVRDFTGGEVTLEEMVPEPKQAAPEKRDAHADAPVAADEAWRRDVIQHEIDPIVYGPTAPPAADKPSHGGKERG